MCNSKYNIQDINNKNKTKRFLSYLTDNSSYIIIQSPNLDPLQTRSIKAYASDSGFKLRMTLKRLLHKVFVGERQSNEKTKFAHNIYQAIPKENANYEMLGKCINKHKCQIVGIVSNNKLIQNYNTYILCELNKTKLLAIIIKILLMPHIISIHYVANKLTSK